MKLLNVAISVILVSMIVLGATTFLTDLGNNYGTDADLTGLNNTQERLNKQQENAQEFSDDITGFTLDSGIDFFLIPYKMVQVGWGVVKQVFGGWVTVETMVIETGSGLAANGVVLPVWLIPSLIAMLILTLIFIVVYAYFKWKFED